MRLLSSVLSFLIASSFVVLNNNFVYATLGDEFEEAVLQNASPECMKDIEALDDNEYIVCQMNMNDYKMNPKEICNIYNNNCKEYFKDPLLIAPNCRDNEGIKSFGFVQLVRYVGLELSASCILDENGNICPISKAYGSGEELAGMDKDKIFHDNCKSKLCTEGFVEVVKDITKIYKQFGIPLSPEKESGLKNVVKQLKTQKCTSLHETSNAISNIKNKIKLKINFFFINLN